MNLKMTVAVNAMKDFLCKRNAGIGFAVLALGSTSFPAYSVDDPAVEEAEIATPVEVPVEPAPISSESVKPTRSELSPYAIKGLLLDITYTGERLIAVGERGNIVGSKDGIQWAQVTSPVRATLTGLSFVDENNGWAVGHDASILRTKDGGKTWELQAYNPELERPLHDVYFSSADRGFVFGSFGVFWETRDGGNGWTKVHAPAILEYGFHLNGLTRLNDGRYLIAGEFGLLGLADEQGENWVSLESPYEGTFFGVVPRGEKGALVYGLRGNAYVSDDPGNDPWRQIQLATVSSIFGAWPMDDGSIILVGADSTVLTVSKNEVVERVPTYAGVASTGTINSIARWPGGLMTVGESGIQPYQTKSSPKSRPVVTLDLESTEEF